MSSNIPPTNSSSRIATDPSSHKSHHHHHFSLHHNRDHDRTPQSAVERLTSPLSDLRQPLKSLTAGLKEVVTEGSRRGSGAAREEAQKSESERSDMEEKPKVTWEDVNRIKARRKRDEQQLLKTVSDLQILGNTANGDINNTYNNLKLTMPKIHVGLDNLSSLSEKLTTLHRDFTTTDIPGYVDFATDRNNELRRSQDVGAKERIDAMEAKMKLSKETLEAVGVRVEVVKKKINRWEEREREVRRRTGRNWQILWAVMGTLLGLWLLLILLRYRPGQQEIRYNESMVVEMKKGRGGHTTDPVKGLRGAGFEVKKKVRESARPSKAERNKKKMGGKVGQADTIDPRLRVFDEL